MEVVTMNSVRICLTVLCALVMQNLVMAADVQPTARDWYLLRTKARNMAVAGMYRYRKVSVLAY